MGLSDVTYFGKVVKSISHLIYGLKRLDDCSGDTDILNEERNVKSDFWFFNLTVSRSLWSPNITIKWLVDRETLVESLFLEEGDWREKDNWGLVETLSHFCGEEDPSKDTEGGTGLCVGVWIFSRVLTTWMGNTRVLRDP